MLQGEHSGILLTCIKLSLVIKIFVFSIMSGRFTQILLYSNTCVKRSLSKRWKIGVQDQTLLDAGQKYCRMLQDEHSAILLTFIKLSFVFKIFVLSIMSGCFIQVLQLYKNEWF